jgi:hypothetical protein
MSATIIKTEKQGITVQVFIPIPEGKENMGMLEREELIQQGINKAGQKATEYALSQFDTDGSPLTLKEKKYTTKGQVSKAYQTPYGEVVLCRHVYQTNEGGCTFCPLDNDARIITSATPKLAKMVSSKYSESAATYVQEDLEDNHGRHLSKQYIQSLSQSIGSLIVEKKNWKYVIEVPCDCVKTVSFSLDGACMLMCDDGYRQAMVGSISLYYFGGERLYTRYIALPPEYGKEQFYKAFDNEIKNVCKLYPNVDYVGVADGAPDNWTFLQSRVKDQILDYFHASEYLTKVSKAAFKRSDQASKWLEKACHTLKEEGGAEVVLRQMKELVNRQIKKEKKEIIQSSITYFTNHLHQMNYSKYLQNNWPIGSGVIEAACKVIVKKRLCNSGMKWKDYGAKTVLALRCFNKSDGMWEQFWNKVIRYGK